MSGQLTLQLHRIACIAAVTVWLAWGYPMLRAITTGSLIRDASVSSLWLVPFLIFGAAMLGAMVLKLGRRLHWTLLGVQVAAVVAMAVIVPWAGMSHFLVIVAWQAAMTTSPGKAFGWAVLQTLLVIGALAQALNPDLCWVIAKAFALQLLLVFTALALRREAATARALAETNRELRSAQAIIANAVRDAERLRISRELHDAWGHELTALGLQLEIASHVVEPGRASDHVMQAKGLSRSLLAKVRDVVSTLREDAGCDVKRALEALARSVPSPIVHVEVAAGAQLGAEQAHALIRCAQEAVTNAVKHSDATNLWLRVTADDQGVRLVAHNDGSARRPAALPGNGLVGMRERIELLGGRLAVQMEAGIGFTVEAWLPSRAPRPA